MPLSFTEQLANCRGLVGRLAGLTPGSFPPPTEEEGNPMTMQAHSGEMLQGTIHVVEDDPGARESLVELFRTRNLHTLTYSSAEDFLSTYKPGQRGCLLIDERLPGMRGSELLRKLHGDGASLPVVFVTAYATTPMTVEAMQLGAVTVLDKPCNDRQLSAAIEDALRLAHERGEKEHARLVAKQRIGSLNVQEREVLSMVLEGTPNKQIAKHQKVCVRTVEARRSKIYHALQVGSVAELVRLCVLAGMIEG